MCAHLYMNMTLGLEEEMVMVCVCGNGWGMEWKWWRIELPSFPRETNSMTQWCFHFYCSSCTRANSSFLAYSFDQTYIKCLTHLITADILLLDEPTSGLDAFTARHLVSSLADIAHKGKTVIMSIHQPRSDIFMLLDKLAILTMGQLAYFGSPKQLVPYFTSIGYPCPRDQNPCDIYRK